MLLFSTIDKYISTVVELYVRCIDQRLAKNKTRRVEMIDTTRSNLDALDASPRYFCFRARQLRGAITVHPMISTG